VKQILFVYGENHFYCLLITISVSLMYIFLCFV